MAMRPSTSRREKASCVDQRLRRRAMALASGGITSPSRSVPGAQSKIETREGRPLLAAFDQNSIVPIRRNCGTMARDIGRFGERKPPAGTEENLVATYSEIVEQAQWGATTHASISEDWAQGRTIFGGLSAGLALRGLLPQVDPERPLRSALTSFVGPVRAGDVAITTQVLRTGRNVTHAQAHVLQGDAHCCTVLACFGKERDTPVHIAPPVMPDELDVDALATPPFAPGISPAFTR